MSPSPASASSAPDVRYVPAVLPGGDVPLANALAFIALAQEITEAALVALVDASASDVVAEGLAGLGEPIGPRPMTVEEQIGGTEAPRPPLTGFELYQAVVHEAGWASRFAAVMLWAESEDAPGGVRPVTEEEAAGPRFPTRAFARAWDPFYSASAELTTGLMGTRDATASSSPVEATPTTALTTPS